MLAVRFRDTGTSILVGHQRIAGCLDQRPARGPVERSCARMVDRLGGLPTAMVVVTFGQGLEA
jgi:hypothetical protein